MKNPIMGGLRVLDLTDKKGMLCGKILAELGMDVIKVEQPGGDASRHIPPFYQNNEDPEKSLFWISYNVNKKAITLDLTKEEGKHLFKKLVAKADFVIESFAPGYMNSLGLGYDELARIKPDIIMASLTPFGQNGPLVNTPAECDLVLQAVSTMLKRVGDPDRAPVKISEVPQSWLHGCMDMVEALMIAHYYRTKSGEGQYIDCAIIESVIGDPVAIGDFSVKGAEGTRPGSVYSTSGKHTMMVRPCKDGYVDFQIRGGSVGLANNAKLVKLMKDKGECTDFVANYDWESFDFFKVPQEDFDKLDEAIVAFFMNHTKAELSDWALEYDLLFGKLSDPEDLINDNQFASRNYWEHIDFDGIGNLPFPGAFAKFTETPLEGYERAPHIGEHNKEIYGELIGLSADEINKYQAAGII